MHTSNISRSGVRGRLARRAASLIATAVAGVALPTIAGAGSITLENQPEDRTPVAAPVPAAPLLPSTTVTPSGDGIPDFTYDPATGDVRFRRDGLAAASVVGEIHIRSLAGKMDPNQLPDPVIGSNGLDVTAPTEIDLFRLSVTGKFTEFADNYDLGPILAANLTQASLLSDLTLTYTIKGSGLPNQTSGLQGVPAPEPAGLSLLAVGAAAALKRRSRKNTDNKA